MRKMSRFLCVLVATLFFATSANAALLLGHLFYGWHNVQQDYSYFWVYSANGDLQGFFSIGDPLMSNLSNDTRLTMAFQTNMDALILQSVEDTEHFGGWIVDDISNNIISYYFTAW